MQKNSGPLDIKTFPWYSLKIYWCKREKLGLPQLPDGEFLKPMDMNCLEKEFKKSEIMDFSDNKVKDQQQTEIDYVLLGI